jgi:hypothetical protein
MTDPLTGETVIARLGSDRRLQTVYRVNMRSACRKGRYERTMASGLHPYLMYRMKQTAFLPPRILTVQAAATVKPKKEYLTKKPRLFSAILESILCYEQSGRTWRMTGYGTNTPVGMVKNCG